jgi:hypothetical protein
VSLPCVGVVGSLKKHGKGDTDKSEKIIEKLCLFVCGIYGSNFNPYPG